MPELIKRKCHNPDASLDEQDLKDIAEAPHHHDSKGFHANSNRYTDPKVSSRNRV